MCVEDYHQRRNLQDVDPQSLENPQVAFHGMTNYRDVPNTGIRRGRFGISDTKRFGDDGRKLVLADLICVGEDAFSVGVKGSPPSQRSGRIMSGGNELM
jgi:hypothetical protein